MISDRLRDILISILICSAMLITAGNVTEDRIFARTGDENPAGAVYAAAEETGGTENNADADHDKNDPQSSFEYKDFHSHRTYRNVLRLKMPDVYSGIADDFVDETTFPIPGSLRTCASGDGRVMSDDYIPQGMCSAGSFILVTAYDAKKKNPSVIYVVDSDNRELVSTLLLPNKYHVGGIAFDGKRIWLTGDTSDKYKGSPFVQYIRYDDFLEMISDSIAVVSKNNISEKIIIKNKPSFLECDSGKLWVGTYIGTKGTKEAYIYGYPIADEENAVLNTILYSVITGVDSSAQGMDIDDNYLYVSSSYKGNSAEIKSSFITKYEISPVQNGTAYLYAADREVCRVEVPKMNEEILVDGGSVYINFESVAKKWINPVIRTDRILAVKKSVWGTKAVEHERG